MRDGLVSARLAGRDCRLRLTLGALAEIESLLRADNLAEVGEKLAQLRAGTLPGVLAALMRGAGATVTEAELRDWPLDLAGATAGIAAAFRAAMPTEDAAAEEAAGARPTAPRRGSATSPSPSA